MDALAIHNPLQNERMELLHIAALPSADWRKDLICSNCDLIELLRLYGENQHDLLELGRAVRDHFDGAIDNAAEELADI